MTKPLVLLMDDDTDYRETLREWLHKRGYRVLVAASPEEALREVEIATPQVAIVDMYVSRENLPDDQRAGLGLVQELKSRGIPCIILTAHDKDGPAVRDALDNARFRPHGYLFKGDGQQAILQKITEVLQETTHQHFWYRSPRVWLFAVFTAFMVLGLYIAITTEHAQLLGIVVVGILIEIVASLVLHYFNL